MKRLLIAVIFIALMTSSAFAWTFNNPFTVHTSVTLESDYGCEEGWQEGALAPVIAKLVASGISIEYIFCVDVSE